MKKVWIAERIDDAAIRKLEEHLEVQVAYGLSREEQLEKVADCDGLIVRSATGVDAELMAHAKKLKVVGRAGNGTDNIDIAEATRRGIVVANTPESNTMSAAELTVTLLLAQSRHVCGANAFLKDGGWERNRFKGTELYQKTLGIVGLGRIGSLVCRRMQAFGMRVVGYDPYISDERFKRLGVERYEKLEDLIRTSDYLTVHTPKNKETFHMIHSGHLPLMKKGVRMANVARGGIIEEAAIVQGIQEGIIASAGIDVHEQEPSRNGELLSLEQVIVTPHLGASTDEAQRNVGMTVVDQVIAALDGSIVPNAVNLPSLHRDELEQIQPYIDLAEKLGKLYYQIKEEPIEMVKIEYFGELAKRETGMIGIAFMKGFLETIISHRVNYINAMTIAESRGIAVREKKVDDFYDGYTEYLRVVMQSRSGTFTLGGNLSTKRQGRIVSFDGFEVDLIPEKHMIVLENIDVPGMIGHVGSVLGEEKVNIATMQLGRTKLGERAMMLLNIDDEAPESCLERLEEHPNVIWARGATL